MLPVQTVQEVQPLVRPMVRPAPEKSIELVLLSTRAHSWSPKASSREEKEEDYPEPIHSRSQQFTHMLLQEPCVHSLLWRPRGQTYSLIPYFQKIWEELERWTLIRGLKGKPEFHPYSKETHRFRDIDLPKKNAIKMHEKLLHANLVCLKRFERCFIAAQYPQEPLIGPIKTTPARELFWKSACYYGSSIIDLTNSSDKNISPYYPLREQEKTCGNMHIQRQKITQLSSGMLCAQYLITDQWKAETIIHRIHFSWKKPRYISLDPLCQLVNLIESLSIQNYLCIHCTNGVGRTGTLITAYFLKQQILREKINYQNLGFSLINMICRFRKQRGPNFVPKPKQLRQLLEYGEFILQQQATVQRS